VHLRRALLLFAIVLGLAAIAASVSRPRDVTQEPARPQEPAVTAEEPTVSESPSTTSTTAPEPTELTFFASDPEPQRIDPGQAATVYVEVDEPGQVTIPDLGISAAAEPLTPARFDLLTRELGRHPIWFEPAGADEAPVRAGTLVIAEAE
jgi:hypothetical protein